MGNQVTKLVNSSRSSDIPLTINVFMWYKYNSANYEAVMFVTHLMEILVTNQSYSKNLQTVFQLNKKDYRIRYKNLTRYLKLNNE